MDINIVRFIKTRSNEEISFPYLIAEAGVNHEGSMDIARRLIDEAKEGGAHAIKFQTYKAETLASRNSPAYWDTTKEPTESQYKLFKKHDSFWKEEFIILKEYCDKAGIEFLSTPFDLEAADFLNDLMPVFKISSSDITNKPFIKYICQYGKPIILSTGASTLPEIEEAVSWIKEEGVSFSLLHCVLNYPTKDQRANLGMITGLKKKFPDTTIGYSDHTLPGDMTNLVVATLLGAQILEKHFTHDKSLQGNDHYHAMDMADLKLFNKRLVQLHELIGSSEVTSLEEERTARAHARRSLVACKRITKGKIIESDDLTWKRPASGISPKYIDMVIGKTALRDIAEDEIMQWSFLSSDWVTK